MTVISNSFFPTIFSKKPGVFFHILKSKNCLRGITTEEIEDFLIKLIRISTLVAPITKPDIIKDDPADNNILAVSLDGNADFIVSGDQHLTSLKEYYDIRILTPAEFIEEVITQLL